MTVERRRGRRCQGDDGIAIILFAFALVGILLMVALVIDMGDLRNSRQENKQLTDVVAAAGAASVAPEGAAKPWAGACAALTFLKANRPSMTFTVVNRDGAANPISGNPCVDRLTQTCTANTPTSWAWIRATSGTFVADIKTGYVTPDPAFAEDAGAYAGDNGVALSGGCDQLAVIVNSQDPALFGRAAGRTSYGNTSRSVARVTVGTEGEGVPAFLMLERKGCDVLSQAVGAGGGEGVIVEPATSTEPGIIHLDTSATGTGCGSGGGASSYGLYSATIGSNPGVISQPAGTTPGVVSLRGLSLNPSAAWASPGGVSPTPTIGKLISRKPVDDKYNPDSPYAPTIANIHQAGYVDANRTTAPSGFTTVSSCSGNMSLTHAKIFVNCPSGFSAGTVLFSAATEVIFNGPIEVKTNNSLFMPAATRVVVGGNSSQGIDVSNGGRIGINSVAFANTDAGVAAACTGREGPAWATTSQLIIFGGSTNALNVTGRGALCQTFVYLAGPKVAGNATYVRQAVTDGSYDSTCTTVKPCPKLTSNTATNAGLFIAGYLKWSAPNQLTIQPVTGSAGVEDLALWTETASLSEVKAGGVLDSRGVFFLPNGRTEMRSPASATPQDAQYIGQSLRLLQGTMLMRPTAGNAVQIPVLRSVGMVR